MTPAALLSQLLAPDGYLRDPHSLDLLFLKGLVVVLLMIALFSRRALLLTSLTLGLLFLIDRGVARAYQPPPTPWEKIYFNQPASLIEKDLWVGYRHKSRLTQTSRKILDGVKIFDVTYTTDEFGRRRTVPVRENAPRFISLFGCSFVFSEGLNDADTLPSQLARNLPDFQVFNYGVVGYGPHQVLALLETKAPLAGIRRKHGIGVYVFMDDHLERAMGSRYVYTRWGGDMPYYFPSAQGELVREGTFTTGRPYLSLWYLLLARSHLVREVADHPQAPSPYDFQTTGQIVAQAQKRFEEMVPQSSFVAVLYPGTIYADGMAAALKHYGVPTLNYSRLFGMGDKNPAYAIPRDGHPTTRAQAIVAEHLAHDLRAMPKPALP